jgi:hypothetical protein
MTIVIKIIAVFYFSSIQSMAASSALQSPLIGITQTTGDVIISGVGVQPATIPALTITNSKIANSTIDLTTKVTGNLPVANLNSGTAANSTTFWRGDGQWTTLAAAGSAGFVGEIIWTQTANCAWSSTGFGGSGVKYTADADCTLPSGAGLEGSALAPTTKIPAIRFSSLDAGHYLIMASGFFNSVGDGGRACIWFISDSTTTKVVGSGGTFTTVGTTTPTLTAHWNHGGGAVEFDIRSTADAVGSTCTTSNDSLNRTLRISVYRM